MELDPNYDYLIENGKVVCKTKKSIVKGKAVDPHDFSWRASRKFDKIDSERQLILDSKPYKCLGRENQLAERSHIKTKDLRRWYPNE